MIRVLRILEYTYETNEEAEDDISRWKVPASGTKYFGGASGGNTIKSAMIIDLSFKGENGN